MPKITNCQACGKEAALFYNPKTFPRTGQEQFNYGIACADCLKSAGLVPQRVYCLAPPVSAVVPSEEPVAVTEEPTPTE